MKFAPKRWWTAALVLAFGGLCVGASAEPTSFRQDAYVWQRVHEAPVRDAISATRETELAWLCPLAAEVAWVNGEARITRVAIDHSALAATGKPVGLVLRVGAYAGPFETDDAATRTLVRLTRELIDEARRAGITPAELQVDFDCAESKLNGYRVWIKALRDAVGETPLVFTALPSWLRHERAFSALAKAADGYVLQVHSLEKPGRGPEADYVLCDPVQALAWVRKADTFGRPFRVALPTYGYRLAFDEQGRFFALSAEGKVPGWPRGTRVKTIRTDPRAMVELARTLKAEAFAHCDGVIWFRLPTAADRLNWDPVTFRRVLTGENPLVKVDVEARFERPGLAGVWFVNRGETSEPLPARVRATWADGERLLVCDGLGGYSVVQRFGTSTVEFVASSEMNGWVVPPGRERQVGWMRFSNELSHVQISLPTEP